MKTLLLRCAHGFRYLTFLLRIFYGVKCVLLLAACCHYSSWHYFYAIWHKNSLTTLGGVFLAQADKVTTTIKATFSLWCDGLTAGLNRFMPHNTFTCTYITMHHIHTHDVVSDIQLQTPQLVSGRRNVLP